LFVHVSDREAAAGVTRPASGPRPLTGRTNRYDSTAVGIDPDAPWLAAAPTSVGISLAAAIDRYDPVEAAPGDDPSTFSATDAAVHHDAGGPPWRCIVKAVVEMAEPPFTTPTPFAVPIAVPDNFTFPLAFPLHFLGCFFVILLTLRTLLSHLPGGLVVARLPLLPLPHFLRLATCLTLIWRAIRVLSHDRLWTDGHRGQDRGTRHACEHDCSYGHCHASC
jgi:hypothetical protein